MKQNNVPFFAEPLEEVPDQELEIRLNDELSRSEQNQERIHAILCELKRRKTTLCEVTPEAAAAWQHFLHTSQKHAAILRPAPTNAIMRVAAMMAIAILLFSVVPTALGADSIFHLVARWTDSIFTLSDPENPVPTLPPYHFATEHPGLQRIYDEVTSLGVTDPVIPSWVPDGYELIELKVLNESGIYKVTAVMQNKNRYTTIDIYLFGTQPVQTIYEKDARDIVVLELQGVTHYLMSNLDINVAVWVSGNMQCSIATDEDYDTLVDILHTIYVTRR